MKRKKIAFNTLIAALLLSSCQYKDFDDYAGTLPVKVVADYHEAGNNYMPAITRSVFYPFSGSAEPFFCDLVDSSYVDLPTGRYMVFAYNNDSEINRTRTYKFTLGNPVIYTEKADNRNIYQADSMDHTVYYDYPDSTYAYYGITDVSGLPEDPDPGRNRVNLKMEKVTRGVYFTIKGMKNTEYIKSFRISLDGVEHEYSPSESFVCSPVAVVADGSIDGQGVLKGHFSVFGIQYTGHIVRIHLNLGSNHKVLLFDVTEQVNKQIATPGDMKIEITTDYNVKKDIPDADPFAVSVGDWENINIPIDGDGLAEDNKEDSINSNIGK